MKNVRMRCAFRYLFCAFVGVLMVVSIHLALISDSNINTLFRNNVVNYMEQDVSTGLVVTKHKQATAKAAIKLTTKQPSLKTNTRSNTWANYRRDHSAKTGNTLIDDYGKNDLTRPGENGAAVILQGEELEEASRLIQKYNLNVYASDRIPLNRQVPDARFPG